MNSNIRNIIHLSQQETPAPHHQLPSVGVGVGVLFFTAPSLHALPTLQTSLFVNSGAESHTSTSGSRLKLGVFAILSFINYFSTVFTGKIALPPPPISISKLGVRQSFHVQTATSHQPLHPGYVCHYPIYPV